MLASVVHPHYCADLMSNHVTDTPTGTGESLSLLASEFTNRINQLGMSRRQLTLRTGLSRQTLHNIEHGARTDLKPSTLKALDDGLFWRAGTALALSHGDASVLEDSDALTLVEKESAYRWRVVERIQRMSLEDLERLVSMMESEALGEDSPMTTDEVISKVEANVMRRIEMRLAASNGSGGGTTTTL